MIIYPIAVIEKRFSCTIKYFDDSVNRKNLYAAKGNVIHIHISMPATTQKEGSFLITTTSVEEKSLAK